MATITVDRDHVASQIEELARDAAGRVLDKMLKESEPARHGLRHGEHLYWSGVLYGLCISIGRLTGEDPDGLNHRFMVDAGLQS